MILRRAQIDAFERAAAAQFEISVCGHLARFFPKQHAQLGDAAVRELIRVGIERASGHGLTSQPAVCKFIDLMIALGSNFDAEEWVGDILGDDTLGDPEKMDILFDTTLIRLRDDVDSESYGT